MKTLAKVLPGILAVVFLLVGLLFMFNPEATLARLELTPEGIAGWAAIRSFIGGTFVGMALLLIHGVVKSEAKPVRMVAILLGAAVIGRLFGLIFDGVNSTVIGPVVIEIVLVAMLLFSSKNIEESESAPS